MGRWISIYLCNEFLSRLKQWIGFSPMMGALNTTYVIKFVSDYNNRFSPEITIFSTNKTVPYDKTIDIKCFYSTILNRVLNIILCG
jgi:hypothetical protein